MRDLSCRALLLLSLTSSFFLQGTLSAPANFATSRYETGQEPQPLQEQGREQQQARSVASLARTRNFAVQASSDASSPDGATTSPEPTPSSSSSVQATPSSSSAISLTREVPEDSSTSEEPKTSSTPATTSSPSSSPTSSSTQSTSSSSTSTSSSTSSSSSSSSTSSSTSTSSSSSSTSSSSTVSRTSSSTSTSESSSTSPTSSSTSPTSTSGSTSTSTSSSLPDLSPTSTSNSTSSSISSTSRSSTASSAISTGKALAACSCGYRLSNFNNLYLRNRLNIDFRKYTSVSQLQSAGLTVANGYQIGNTAPDGTYVYASSSNIKFGSDGVHLLVPGGQSPGGQVSGAQLLFNNGGRGMTRMYAEAEIQVDATPGTCQAFWTFTNDMSATSDEQDMEIIAASLLTPSEVKEAGLQLTNHAPDKSGNKDHRTVPFPSDPSVGFHNYTIAWDRSSVSYSFDGQLLAGPTELVSQNPSNLIFNNAGTGFVAFYGAPLPAETVNMRVRSLRLYYETDFTSTLPSGCTESNVCVV